MATEVLQNFSQTQLYKMVRQEGLKGDEDTSSKKLIEALREAIEEIGINLVTANMKKDTLDKMIEPLKIEIAQTEKGAPKQVSKMVIRKRIATQVAEEGLDKFFSSMDEDLLEDFFEASPTDEEREGKKKFAAQVARCVAEAGLQVFFNRFNVEFLQDLMESSKLKYNTQNQNALALALASQTPALKEKKKTSKSPKPSSKKLPIEKGITYQDIFQHYYAEDLHDYCKEHELKNSGTKKELINRILKYLDGDESTKAGSKSPKRKRSTSASRTKKASTKKSSKKKPESEDEKESDDKEEEGEKEEKETKKEKEAKEKDSKKSTEKKSTKKSKKDEEKDEE